MRFQTKRSIRVVLPILMMFFLVFSAGLTGCGTSPGQSKTVANGETWTVSDTTALSGELTIQDGAVVEAPEGYLLTLTVDGVEKAIAAGTYSGDIVLTPTKKIAKALYNGKMTQGANTDYRTALFIDANEVIEESSVTSALVGGDYDMTSASGMTITSDNILFNGMIIDDSEYTVSDVTMTANGPGGNDFTGFGAGIAVTGTSNVVIDNFNFTAEGPLRHGIFVGGEKEEDNLTVTVKNSFLKTDGSVGDVIEGLGSGMTGVPWVLGLETYAHVRTQMIAGFADVTYENCTLLSDGWGVLSTDDVSITKNYGDYAVKLNVKDSIVDFTGTSGYGTYAIGDCYNAFDNTVIGGSEYSGAPYAMTYAMVCANEYAGGEFMNGTHVTARYGVMWHKNQTGLTKVDSSTFDTLGANFLIKHCYPVIEVNNSNLNSETGVIVQLMGSDDPGLGKPYFTELLDPSEVAKDEDHDIYSVNKTDTTIFSTQLKDVVSDAQVSFSDMEINGNFFNSVSGVDDDDLHIKGENLVLDFDNVKINGIISASSAIHRNYSYYLAKETDADGNQIVLNAEGYQIDGSWEESSQGGPGGGMMGGMPGGDAAGGGMPEGMGAQGGMGMPEGGMGGGQGMPEGGMPEGGGQGMPGGDMAQGGAPGGQGMPGGEGGMPGGEGGMPGGAGGDMAMGGGMGGGSSKEFTPATDENGNYIVIGTKKYDLYEGIIVKANPLYLGDLKNTPAPAGNNGVIVTLSGGSVWTVAGTSYLTSLTVEDATITGPEGAAVTMTVNGKNTKIESGKTYTGDIVIK